jgi:uncharacterized membrane protein
MPSEKHHESHEAKTDPFLYFLTYLLELVSGIVVYAAYGKHDSRLRKHAVQATLLGVLTLIELEFFGLVHLAGIGSLIAFIIWIYCLFVGFEAYNGRDVDIPMLSDRVK